MGQVNMNKKILNNFPYEFHKEIYSVSYVQLPP